MGQLAAGPGLTLYASSAALILSWAVAPSEGAAEAARRMRSAIAEYTRPGSEILHPLYTGRLAELEALGSDASAALATADEALGFAQRSGERWSDSLLHRIRGDVLRKVNPADPALAEEAYLAAIAVARDQGARSFGLQAALTLAKLYQSTCRPVAAHEVLALAFEGFSPTPELPEAAEAQDFLARLAETGEAADAGRPSPNDSNLTRSTKPRDSYQRS